MKKKIKVLHCIAELNSGGVERLLYNYYVHMNRDEIQWDFVITAGDEHVPGMLEQPLKDLGSKIYYVPRKRESLLGHIKAVGNIIKNNNYDVVHAHIDEISAFYMYYAKKYGVKMRITHSHLALADRGFMVETLCVFLKPLVKYLSNNWFACGLEAGKSLWGKKAVGLGKVHIVNNAIDTKKFAYDNEKREEIRKSLGIEKNIVIGSVGRFSYQKNSEYIIETFKEVHSKNAMAKLVLVGCGELENKMRDLVSQYNLENEVRFLGTRSDVNDIMKAIDIFLLPSRFEGLPIVLVEAQCAGLPCVVSSKITKEVNVTNLIKYVPLDLPASEWAKEVLSLFSLNNFREDGKMLVEKYGYDISIEAQKLQKYYSEKLK
jgi:glycosyltransferase involved in cell wall biosynthesis